MPGVTEILLLVLTITLSAGRNILSKFVSKTAFGKKSFYRFQICIFSAGSIALALFADYTVPSPLTGVVKLLLSATVGVKKEVHNIVFAPKYRRKVFYEEKRMEIREILRKLCQWKGVEVIEGEICPDHIHMLVSIPPKMSVAGFMGFLNPKRTKNIGEMP